MEISVNREGELFSRTAPVSYFVESISGHKAYSACSLSTAYFVYRGKLYEASSGGRVIQIFPELGEIKCVANNSFAPQDVTISCEKGIFCASTKCKPEYLFTEEAGCRLFSGEGVYGTYDTKRIYICDAHRRRRIVNLEDVQEARLQHALDPQNMATFSDRNFLSSRFIVDYGWKNPSGDIFYLRMIFEEGAICLKVEKKGVLITNFEYSRCEYIAPLLVFQGHDKPLFVTKQIKNAF